MNSPGKILTIFLVLSYAAWFAASSAIAAPPPKVRTVTPDSAVQGEELTVTIGGSGFENGAAVRFLVADSDDDTQVFPTGPAVLDDSDNLVVPIEVLGTATVELYDVEVINLNNGRRGKGTDLFRVESSSNSGGGGDQSNTPLKVTFNQLVGPDNLPSNLVHDAQGPLYIHKQFVDAKAIVGQYWSGIFMDFPGLRWRGGRGRQLYIDFVCDDTTVLGGDCTILETDGAIEFTGNGDERRAILNTFQFSIYQHDDCPLPNTSCPSQGIFDMTPGVSEMISLTAIVKSARPYLLLQSNPSVPKNCINLLSAANQQIFMDSCFENPDAPPGAPFCNAIITGTDLDPGAGNGNDRWTIEAENATGLLCNDDDFIGVMTLSLDVLVERRD